MTRKDILDTLEKTISTLEQAKREREEELRALLYVCEVSKLEEVEEVEKYRLGAELDNQIDILGDLLDELKYQAVKIGAFKPI